MSCDSSRSYSQTLCTYSNTSNDTECDTRNIAVTQNVTHTNIIVTQKQHQCREEAGTATVTTQPNWLQMMIKFKLEKEPKVKHLKD